MNAIQADQQLFDVGDAAIYLQQIGARTATINFVRTLISTGQVAHLKIGKKYYVGKAALDQWINRREKRSR